MSQGPLKLGGVPEHFNLPWHRAMASPACADLDLAWEDQPGGTGQMLSKLAAGQLDMVSILTEGTVSAIAKGTDLTILQVYVSSPLQWGQFAPAVSDHRVVTDMDRPRIAISRHNSGSHLMAFILARSAGWTLTEDQFVVVGGLDGAIEAFAGAKADLFLWDQYMTSPLVAGGQFRQLGVTETPWPSFVIAVRTEVLAGRTTEVGRVTDAVVAEAGALHDSPGIVEHIAARYGLDLDTAKSWLASTTFGPRSAFDPVMATDVLDTLAQAGFD